MKSIELLKELSNKDFINLLKKIKKCDSVEFQEDKLIIYTYQSLRRYMKEDIFEIEDDKKEMIKIYCINNDVRIL